MNSKLALNKAHFPVTTLGPGSRIGLWFQGCSIRCPGCISVDTWEFSRSHQVELPAVFELMERWLPHADGLTISGGEPFDQPAALEAILEWYLEHRDDGDVLIFSGYGFPALERKHRAILEKTDALVSGPFLETSTRTKSLRGSDNQTLHLLSNRGRERFSNAPEPLRALDVHEDGDQVWFAGIPVSDDWEKFGESLADAGITAKFSHLEH